MPKPIYLLLTLLPLLTPACLTPAQPPPTNPPCSPAPCPPAPPQSEIPNPQSTPTPLKYTIQPAPPGAATPQVAMLYLQINVRDAATGQPVPATIRLGPHLLATETSSHTIALQEKGPDPPSGRQVSLHIEAPGYQPWNRLLRGDVDYNRLIPVNVLLERVE